MGDSDDLGQRAGYAAVAYVVALAGASPEPAFAAAFAAQVEALSSGGAAADAVRTGWADTVRGAISLSRLDDARSLIALLADLPPGCVPPSMGAHLALAQSRLGIAEGHHDQVEAKLRAAIDGFAGLGHPFDLALVQAELAGWLMAGDVRRRPSGR